MLYLLVEIGSLKQIQQTKKDLASSLMHALSSQLLNSGFELISSDDDYIFYASDFKSSKTGSIAQAVFSLYQRFKYEEGKLQGFTFLINFDTEIEATQSYILMKHLLYTTFSDNDFLLSESAYVLFQDYYQVEIIDDIFCIKALKEQKNLGAQSFLEFALRPDLFEQITDNFSDSVTSGNNKLLVFESDGSSCVSENLKLALQALYGDQFENTCLSIDNQRKTIYESLISFVLTFYHYFLTKVEPIASKELLSHFFHYWEILVKKKHNILFSELKILFLTILALYQEYCECNSIQGCIEVKGFHLWNNKAQNDFLSFVESFSPNIMLVLHVDKFKTRKLLKKIHHEIIEVPKYSIYEFNEFISSQPFKILSDASQIYRVSDGNAFYLYHALNIHSSEKNCSFQTQADILDFCLHQLSLSSKKLLFLIALSDGNIHIEFLKSFSQDIGINSNNFTYHLQELNDNGLYSNKLYPKVNDSLICQKLQRELQSDGRFIESLFIEKVFICWRNGLSLENFKAYTFLINRGSSDIVTEVLNKVLSNKLDCGFYDYVSLFFENYQNNSMFRSQLSNDQALRLGLKSLELRMHLLNPKLDNIDSIFKSVLFQMNLGENQSSAFAALEISKYYHLKMKYTEALEWAKKASLQAKPYDNDQLNIGIHIQIGLCMLVHEKIEEAIEYFSLARRLSEGKKYYFEAMESVHYEVIGQYFYGNLAKAYIILQSSKPIFMNPTQHLMHYMLLMRVSFDIGEYENASRYAIEGCRLSTFYKNVFSKQLFQRWLFRSLAFSYKPLDRTFITYLKKTKHPEFFLFYSEYFILQNQKRKAYNSIEKALSYLHQSIDERDKIAQIFSNGFFPIEDIISVARGTKSCLEQIIHVYKEFLSSILEDDYDSLDKLKSIAKDAKIAPSELLRAQFLFLVSDVLSSSSNQNNMDKITILGMSLKIIQRLSGRMDSKKIKQAFLYQNYWNKKIVAEAKKYKLF